MIKNIINSIRMKYRDLSYQNKLVIAIFTIIMLPIFILSSYSYSQNASLIKKHAITISKLYLDQVQKSINSCLDELANTAMILSRYDNVTNIVEKDPGTLSISEQLADLRNLDILVSGFLASEVIYDIRIYVNEGFIYSNRGVTTYNIKDNSPQQWSAILQDNSQSKYFQGPYTYIYSGNNSQRIISFMIPIRSSTNFDRIVSLISVDMKEDDLLHLMSIADFTKQGLIMITDQEYQPLTSYSDKEFDEDHLSNKELIALEEQDIDALVADAMVYDNNIIGVTALSNSWKLISIITIKDLLTVQSDMRYQFFLLVLIAMIGVYLIAYVYARHNANRINALSRQLHVVESGNFNVSCLVDSSDEIGILQTSFNYMVKEINALMIRQYQSGRDLNMMELKVLQAQINPHFLYNTLDLILWTAKKNDMDQVCDIIIRLSRYYRISLSNGSDYIDLKDELEHARLYIELQNLRFIKKVELSINIIDEELLSVKIMKLLLQPIVENSIHHGIANSDYMNGLINIDVSKVNEDLLIVITDNGIGMDPNVISFLKVYQNMRDANGYIGGFGLKNVLDRLRLYYDQKASINFESVPGSGTTVTITMPLNWKR